MVFNCRREVDPTTAARSLNIYGGQKQAGRTWSQHLTKGLLLVGFAQSSADDCICFKESTIFMVYVDNGIFTSDDDIDRCIVAMKAIFNLTDHERNIS